MEQPPQMNPIESSPGLSLEESINPSERIKFIKLAQEAIRKVFSKRNLEIPDLPDGLTSFENMGLVGGGHFDMVSKKVAIEMFGDYRLRTYIHEFLHASTDSKKSPVGRVGKTGLASLWEKGGGVKYFEALNEALTEVLADEALDEIPKSDIDPIIISLKKSLKEREKIILTEYIDQSSKRQIDLLHEKFALEDLLFKLVEEGGEEKEIQSLVKKVALKEVESDFAGKFMHAQVDYMRARFDVYANEIKDYRDEKMYLSERQLLHALVSKISELQGLTIDAVLEQFKLAYLQGNIFGLRIIQNSLGKDIFETIAHLSPQNITPNETELAEAQRVIGEALSTVITEESPEYFLVLQKANHTAQQRYYNELITKIESIQATQN